MTYLHILCEQTQCADTWYTTEVAFTQERNTEMWCS